MMGLLVYLLIGTLLGILFVEVIARNNENIQEKWLAFFLLWVLIWPVSLLIMIHAFVYTAIKLLRERKK